MIPSPGHQQTECGRLSIVSTTISAVFPAATAKSPLRPGSYGGRGRTNIGGKAHVNALAPTCGIMMRPCDAASAVADPTAGEEDAGGDIYLPRKCPTKLAVAPSKRGGSPHRFITTAAVSD